MNLKQQIADICNDIEFDELHHVYTLDGTRFQTVSSKYSSYSKKTDWGEMAKNVARSLSKKHGTNITAEEVQASWNKKRDDSAQLGTKVHNFIQYYPHLTREPELEQEVGALNFFRDLPKQYEIVAQEKILYSKSLGIAGTLDLLCYNTMTNTLAIFDFKSNADLEKNFRGQTLLYPFQDLLDTPANKYALQLNLYAILLQEHIQIPVSEMFLVHLHPSLPDFYKLHKVDNLMPLLTLSLQ